MKKQEIIEAARTIALEHGAGRGFSPTIHFSPPIRKEKDLPSRPDFKKPKTYLKVTALTIQGLTFLKHIADAFGTHVKTAGKLPAVYLCAFVPFLIS